MSSNSIDIVRQFVHIVSLALLVLVITTIVVGLIRPDVLKAGLREFAERKFIFIFGIFACLLCATIFTATQSISRSHDSQHPKTTPEEVKSLPTPLVEESNTSQNQPNTQGSVNTHTEQQALTEMPVATQAPAPKPTATGSSTQAAPQASAPASQPQQTAPAPQPTENNTPDNSTDSCEGRGLLGSLVCNLL